MHMQRICRACYFDLLLLQFHRGAFSEAEARECLGPDADRWPQVKDKFIEVNDLFYNERLAHELERRKKFSESRKAGAYALHVHRTSIKNAVLMENRIKDVKSNQVKSTTVKTLPVIPDHLCMVWPEYLQMRRSIKKPATPKAQQLIVKELERLAPGNNDKQVAIVEQSIAQCWQGVFPLKQNDSPESLRAAAKIAQEKAKKDAEPILPPEEVGPPEGWTMPTLKIKSV